MFGVKSLLIVYLFINVLVSGYQGDQRESLDDLMQRVLARLEAQRDDPARRGSWDSYIDNLIAQSKDASGTAHADKACIIGLDGGAKWTTDGHANALKLSASEGANIARAFKSKDFTSFMANGIRAESVKYQFLRVEDDKVVYAKKKGYGGLTLQASKTAIVIGHSPEGSQQGNLNKAVGVIADYLESISM